MAHDNPVLFVFLVMGGLTAAALLLMIVYALVATWLTASCDDEMEDVEKPE